MTEVRPSKKKAWTHQKLECWGRAAPREPVTDPSRMKHFTFSQKVVFFKKNISNFVSGEG